MISKKIQDLEEMYVNDRHTKIGEDVFMPCLKECTKYRRGTGTYGSSFLYSYLGAIGSVVKNGTIIEIICSMNNIYNDKTLFNALKKNVTEEQKNKTIQNKVNNIGLIVAGCQTNNPRDYFHDLICYLLAHDQLIIKFALPLNEDVEGYQNSDSDSDINNQAMYHFKYGYFEYDNGDKVVFNGSVNETETALRYNGEIVSIYKSWVESHAGPIKFLQNKIDADWNESTEGYKFYNLSEETLEEIKKHSGGVRPKPKDYPTPIPNPPVPPTPEPTPEPTPAIDPDAYKWRHKDAALKVFMEKKVGILKMATGTGKTSTAIKIATHLFKKDLIDSVIITMKGNPLLNQWYKELMQDGVMQEKIIIRHYEQRKERQAFINDPKGKILLVTSLLLGETINHITDEIACRSLVIYDEVHDMGAPEKMEATAGKHLKFIWRLGLSATPERSEFDPEGTAFIFNEIGPIIFQFDINTAIERGILVEFDYKPLTFKLTEEETTEIAIIIRKFSHENADKEMMALLVSNVKKTATNKLVVFKEFILQNNCDFLKKSIIFVHTMEYGHKVTKIMNEARMTSYNTFYSEDNEENLKKLANGEIDCLVTCHKVSQGIDIKSLENVIIFSSNVHQLETIQRLGRALRTEKSNPNKKAFLLDFCAYDNKVDEESNRDTQRKDWLSKLASTKKLE